MFRLKTEKPSFAEEKALETARKSIEGNVLRHFKLFNTISSDEALSPSEVKENGSIMGDIMRLCEKATTVEELNSEVLSIIEEGVKNNTNCWYTVFGYEKEYSLRKTHLGAKDSMKEIMEPKSPQSNFKR